MQMHGLPRPRRAQALLLLHSRRADGAVGLHASCPEGHRRTNCLSPSLVYAWSQGRARAETTSQASTQSIHVGPHHRADQTRHGSAPVFAGLPICAPTKPLFSFLTAQVV